MLVQEEPQKPQQSQQLQERQDTGYSSLWSSVKRNCEAETKRDLIALEAKLARLGENDMSEQVKQLLSAIRISFKDAMGQRQRIYRLADLLSDMLTKAADPNQDHQTEIAEANTNVDEVLSFIKTNSDTFTTWIDKFRKDMAASQNARAGRCGTEARENACFAGALSGTCIAGVVGCLSSMQPASLAKIPYLGHCLTKVKVSGGGFFGGKSTSIVMAGAASSSLCLCASCACLSSSVCLCVGLSCELKKRQQKEAFEAYEKCWNSAKFHLEFWQGLDIVCQDYRNKLTQLKSNWRYDMKDLGRRMIQQTWSTDIYIVALEECGYIPMIFDVEALLGERYQVLKRSFANAHFQAMTTHREESSASQATSAPSSEADFQVVPYSGDDD